MHVLSATLTVYCQMSYQNDVSRLSLSMSVLLVTILIVKLCDFDVARVIKVV